MPSDELIEELAHELKDQLALNVDLRNESELFFERESRAERGSAQRHRENYHDERHGVLL